MPPAKAAITLAEQVRRSFKAAILRLIVEMRCAATFMEPCFMFIVMPSQVISCVGGHTDFFGVHHEASLGEGVVDEIGSHFTTVVGATCSYSIIYKKHKFCTV